MQSHDICTHQASVNKTIMCLRQQHNHNICMRQASLHKPTIMLRPMQNNVRNLNNPHVYDQKLEGAVFQRIIMICLCAKPHFHTLS